MFSQTKLVQSQRALLESGYFVRSHIQVHPQLLPETDLMNVKFVVLEK